MVEDKQKQQSSKGFPRVHQSLTCIFGPDGIGGSHLHRLGSQCFLAQGAKTLAVGQGATTSHGAKLWITFSFIIRYYQSLYVPLEPPDPQSFTASKFTDPVQCHAIHIYSQNSSQGRRSDPFETPGPWPLVSNCCCWRSASSHCDTKLRNKKWMHRSVATRMTRTYIWI